MLERLTNKNIILGITGSIAAYKAGDIVRRLRDAGAQVRVVMTRAATEFVTPMTFQALSGHPVHQHLLDADAEAAMGHIALARWADAILVAPATADFLSRLRLGRSDDLLSAVCLAGDVPLAVAPAMNNKMWEDPATQENVQILKARGIVVCGPDEGSQACGEMGAGRMQEPMMILQQLAEVFASGAFTGIRMVITAGPTQEPIDPVRYISNHSSGKMGYALAAAATEAGAQVTLISGPVNIAPPRVSKLIQVTTAMQMHESVMAHVPDADIFIGTAAVADYRPQQVASQKIKKGEETQSLQLVRNPDILTDVKQLHSQVYCVGFAAETEDLIRHARDKLQHKRVDMIAANWVGPQAHGGGFGSDTNALVLCWRDGEVQLEMAPKSKLAREMLTHVAQCYAQYVIQRKDSARILPFKGHTRGET